VIHRLHPNLGLLCLRFISYPAFYYTPYMHTWQILGKLSLPPKQDTLSLMMYLYLFTFSWSITTPNHKCQIVQPLYLVAEMHRGKNVGINLINSFFINGNTKRSLPFSMTLRQHTVSTSLLQAHLVHILKEEEKPETSQRTLQPSSFPCASRSNVHSLFVARLR